GARSVLAADTDPYAVAALGLNAAANGVALAVSGADLTAGPPPPVDLVLVGDLFYEEALARRVTAFLERCRAAGMEILIGDPGRAYLPRERPRKLAEYAVPDVGDVETKPARPSAVFAFVGGGSG